MFNNNTYPCYSTSDIHNLDGAHDEILFLHHHDLLVEPPATAIYNNQDFSSWLNGDLSTVVNTFRRKSSEKGKKDRHSKIFTSHGPRDRRVRLSIGIARKFFDLQELLGFDKPSKTLDWLLNKSKAAITELVQKKQHATSSTKSTISNSLQPSECEVVSGNISNSVGTDSRKKSVFLNAKDSRAKARARARERTREKMCVKMKTMTNESRNSYGYDLSPSIPIQYMDNQFGVWNASGSNAALIFQEPALSNEDLIQESVAINNKLNHPPSILGSQQNVIFSGDSSSNCGMPSSNASENRVISSYTAQSDLFAIFDQHRFINSISKSADK